MVALVLALTLFGLVMIFSASYYNSLSKYGNAYTYLRQGVVWFILGWIAFWFFGVVWDYHIFRAKRIYIPILLVGLGLLVLIKSPLGININNATRWLNFYFFTVMPGEVIKFCLIIFIASYLDEDPSRVFRWKDGLVPILVAMAASFVLIMMQPNLSTAGIVALMCVGMLFVAGLKIRYLLMAGALGVAAFAGIIFSPKGAYMLQRVQTFLDPFKDALGTGYQVVQGLLALGSGGVFGVGLGKSVQKALYLPEPMNDFIIAIIGEEIGFVGLMVMFGAYMLLIWRCCKIAMNASDFYGMMLASGVSILLGLQVVLNIAVVTASFFPTGVFLPFVSLGGSATIIFMALMGIVFNVSRN